jgi:enoyl-CoA hydratase/carnithine racemase
MALNYEGFKEIKVEILEQDQVAIVVLNRPDRLNAWTDMGMGSDLVRAFNNFDKDDRVRVVVVTGGGKAFCAGADLQKGDFAEWNRKHAAAAGVEPGIRTNRDGGGQVSLAINRCRKVSIAAINGAAVGIGITVTLPMDIRIVWQDAKIGFVFTRRAIVPEACSTFFLPRLVGYSRAMSLLLNGEVNKASKPELALLWSKVVEKQEDVLPTAMEMAKSIAANTSAISCAMVKSMIWRGYQTPEEQHLLDSKAIFELSQSVDGQEGIRSFMEKRSPKFPGKLSKDMPGFWPWWNVVTTDGVPKL